MPDFFIRRPIFAWVVALLISLMGLLAIPSLPIAQYPDIAPPVITLRTTYPGASAQDTEEAVTAVIEKEINGAPGLMYMSATSSSTRPTPFTRFSSGMMRAEAHSPSSVSFRLPVEEREIIA